MHFSQAEWQKGQFSTQVTDASTACASLAEQAEQLEELSGVFRVG